MESFITPFVNLGIGGMMAGVVVYFLHHLVTKVLPQLTAQREADLAWAREEMDRKRGEYLAALDKQQTDFCKALEVQRNALLTALERAEGRWEKATNEICDRLERIEERLAQRGE